MEIPSKERYVPGDVIATLRNCHGYYERPVAKNGRRIGPLVVYAGTYEVNEPGEPKFKHYVGHTYYNMAKAEVYPEVLERFAADWKAEWYKVWYKTVPRGTEDPKIFLAAPMGGILFAAYLAAMFNDAKVVYAEKKVKKIGQGLERDETELVLDRHADEILPGDQIVIVEDVCNNLTTASALVKLVEEHNGCVAGLGCVIDRSVRAETQRLSVLHRSIPIVSVARVPTVQFRQDDPEVAADVQMGYVVWKPKAKGSWRLLMDVMDENAAGE